MIGIISKEDQRDTVCEFFELFKTPWEFYHETSSYEVVITTRGDLLDVDAKLIILYGAERTLFDKENTYDNSDLRSHQVLVYNNILFPIYGKTRFFHKNKNAFTKAKDSGSIAGYYSNRQNRRYFRIGFDLFSEIKFLLNHGQPSEYAQIPTLEIHISMLRTMILSAGIPFVEIPPVPLGYNFITCLTHDVDFAGIRFHKFDRTVLGFLYRSTIGSFLRFFNGRLSWKSLLINLKACFNLPLVYLGLAKDFFDQFDRYIKLEKDLKSSFFVSPLKNYGGKDNSGKRLKSRAMKYDIFDIVPQVKKLISNGFEVGLHGIDACWDPEKGREESAKISKVTGEYQIGLRMHWLYFSEHSFKVLDDSGFKYDSTFGYNDAVGFRAGTVQVFRPVGVKNLLELPLNIQDTALFYPGRMNLSRQKAAILIDDILKHYSVFGGALTINWHQRSLGPERQWGHFYIHLLKKFKKYNIWFSTAGKSVRWFMKRRLTSFKFFALTSNNVKLALRGYAPDDTPGLVLRIYRPTNNTSANSISYNFNLLSYDLPIHRDLEFNITI